MDITFVLPAPVRVPSGGPAVVLRHARGLAQRGHKVRVVAPHRIPGERGRLFATAVALRDRWQGVVAPAGLSAGGVEIVEPRALRQSDLVGNAVIATGVQTVKAVNGTGKRGWWFVQGDETFVRPDAREAWHLGLRMVPCSQWLASDIRQVGGTVEGVVPNAVDTAVFGLDTPPNHREDAVLALYHWHSVKGPDTLIQVYERLRQHRPEVKLRVFAARTPRHRMPTGVEVIVRPSPEQLRSLYNESAVFLHTSAREGWALTPMEAATCGAAVVATASLGPAEYLTAGESMIETGVGDVDALVQATLALLDDPARRVRQAARALQDVSRFSWQASTDRFEDILLRGTAR